MKTKSTSAGTVVSIAQKAQGPGSVPSPTSGAWGQQPGGVPPAPKSLAGLPTSNRGSELFSDANNNVAADTRAGVVRALRAGDAAADATFEVR